MLARAKPLKELSSWNDNADELVVNWLAWKPKAADDFVYYPLQARGGLHTLVLNKNGELMGYCRLNRGNDSNLVLPLELRRLKTVKCSRYQTQFYSRR